MLARGNVHASTEVSMVLMYRAKALEMLPSNKETRNKRRQLHIQTLRILLRESSSELTLDDLIGDT